MGSVGVNDVQSNGAPLPPLWDHRIDDYRRMKVICIGAGMSGILAGIRFPQLISNLDFTIYDKNSDVGGTWFENNYAGVRCDIPSASYQYTFESNPGWTEYYAEGAEIQSYLKRTARKFGVYDYCKFGHKMTQAKWNEDDGKWEMTMEEIATGKVFVDTCDVYISAVGILNNWKYPDIEGFKDFKGQVMHSADWDKSYDFKGKNAAVIGAGSSGIQIVPALQPLCNRIDHYMKGKTWISPIGFGSQELQLRGAKGNFKHSQEELESFKDPAEYLKFRRRIEETVNTSALITIYGTDTQKDFYKINKEAMGKKLEKKPEIMEALEPSWPPGCRRLTPGPGYLEALVEDNVNFISKGIKRFTPTGIETEDGTQRDVDIIVCATGFDTTLRQPMPVLGQGGANLNDVWDPIPECYFGIFPPKMPNMFRFLGPNGAPGTGGTIHLIEEACLYMVKVIQKLQREYIKSIVVRPEAMGMLSKHIDSFFTKTIYTQPCKSWMKRGKEDGRVVTLWPGSCIHAVVAFENPRWEDFEYTRLPETQDTWFAWLGKGLSMAQDEGMATTEFLETVNKPPAIYPQTAEEHEPTKKAEPKKLNLDPRDTPAMV